MDADRIFQSERARFAAALDADLRLVCRSEAAMRRELGCAARELVRRRSYRRLGFVRLSDYARERLGVSARTLQSAAWLASRLDALPALSRAYDRAELSWAQARAICRVAVAGDEGRWLAVARGSTVEVLERLVDRALRPPGVPADPEGDPNEIDGEPALRWRFACPARVRALWRRALELASRAAGEPLAEWRAAEVVAAEASSGRPVGSSLGDRALWAAMRLARCARGKASPASTNACAPADEGIAAGAGGRSPAAEAPFEGGARASKVPEHDPLPIASPTPHSPTAPEPFELEPPPSTDPFALDARVFEAMRVEGAGARPVAHRVADAGLSDGFGAARARATAIHGSLRARCARL